ncbi:hypothetical protein ACJX0J_015414, partial [Zea mays]
HNGFFIAHNHNNIFHVHSPIKHIPVIILKRHAGSVYCSFNGEGMFVRIRSGKNPQ